MYLHARYYDSVLGVFLSPDPIGADLHTYGYGAGDPVNRRDPSGLVSCFEGVESWNDETGSEGSGEWLCLGGSAGQVEVGTGAPGGWGGEAIPQVPLCQILGECGANAGDGTDGSGTANTGTSGSGEGSGTGTTTSATNAEVAKEVTKLMKDFVTGTGKEKTFHGPGSAITKQMMSAPAVNALRTKFEKSDQSKSMSAHSSFGLVSIFGAQRASLFSIDLFGDDSPFALDAGLARQFLGSFDLTVFPRGDGSSLFVIEDSKSAWSLFAHQTPSINRVFGLTLPVSTTYQTYWWIEGDH